MIILLVASERCKCQVKVYLDNDPYYGCCVSLLFIFRVCVHPLRSLLLPLPYPPPQLMLFLSLSLKNK